jgi:hypothetical protein
MSNILTTTPIIARTSFSSNNEVEITKSNIQSQVYNILKKWKRI